LDDASRAILGVLDDRSDWSMQTLKGFIAMVQNQFYEGVKEVRSDTGLEFTSEPMQGLYFEHGI